MGEVGYDHLKKYVLVFCLAPKSAALIDLPPVSSIERAVLIV